MNHVFFKVDGDVFAAFSPNRPTSSWERSRRRKQWRERAWLAWYESGAVVLRAPVRVTITVFRHHEVDRDNLVSSCKVILDSLTPKQTGPMKQSCLPDDSPRTIKALEVLGEFGPSWRGHEWVSVEVQEMEDGE